MGGCASKPKESDIIETPAATENNAVVESKNIEPEAVSQEKADEVVAEKKEESAGEVAETQDEAEAAKPAEVEAAKPAEAVKSVDETEQPKQEEAAKTNEEPLVTL